VAGPEADGQDVRDELPEEPGFIKLDWHEYYARFKEAHGRDSVPYKGRRLFMDGWMYSGKDASGDEYPPPQDPVELCRLQLTYWRVRKFLVTNELQQLRSIVTVVRNLQSTRSMPLLQSVFTLDEEQGKRVLKAVEVDTKKMEDQRIKWLEEDAEECDLRIDEHRRVYSEYIAGAKVL
jgi:hypothetical protein